MPKICMDIPDVHFGKISVKTPKINLRSLLCDDACDFELEEEPEVVEEAPASTE